MAMLSSWSCFDNLNALTPVDTDAMQDAVYSVAYDKINGLIASGSKDKTIRLWHPSV